MGKHVPGRGAGRRTTAGPAPARQGRERPRGLGAGGEYDHFSEAQEGSRAETQCQRRRGHRRGRLRPGRGPDRRSYPRGHHPEHGQQPRPRAYRQADEDSKRFAREQLPLPVDPEEPENGPSKPRIRHSWPIDLRLTPDRGSYRARPVNAVHANGAAPMPLRAGTTSRGTGSSYRRRVPHFPRAEGEGERRWRSPPSSSCSAGVHFGTKSALWHPHGALHLRQARRRAHHRSARDRQGPDRSCLLLQEARPAEQDHPVRRHQRRPRKSCAKPPSPSACRTSPSVGSVVR